MDYDSLSEEELKDRLANASATDLSERLKLRAALEKHQSRKIEKRKWSRKDKITVAATIGVPLLLAAVGGAYKLLQPDKPNPAPSQQTDTSKPTVPPAPAQTPKNDGPTVAPIPNPKMHVQKVPDNFVSVRPPSDSVPYAISLSDIRATLLGSTWVGQFPFARSVNVRLDFQSDATVNIKCGEDDSRCAAYTLPTATWTLDGNNVEISFSGVDTLPKEVAAAQHPMKVLATGTVADNSIQGLVKIGDQTSQWILLPHKKPRTK
jgi:hypothetical protein